MSETLSAVVAGSKGFVDALQGHLKMRLGAAPRVARDPAEALRACADRGGLLVLEYAGGPWLDAVKSLRGACGEAALSIVAAVPLAQAADVRPLQRAGVDEVVSWQGRVDPVIWAVDRIVGRQSAAPPGPLPVADPLPQGTDGSANAPADPRESPISNTREVASPLSVPSTAPLVSASPLAPVPAAPWPGGVPSAAEAEALLLAVLAGQVVRNGDERDAAERVLAGASDLERAALAAAEVPVDPASLRSVTALRLRLDLALASLPSLQEAVDHAAGQQLLADVDSALARIKQLGTAASAGSLATLEPIRDSIVERGVQLAAALSGLVPAGEVEVRAPPATAPRSPGARVLTNERDEPSPRPHRVLWVLLALALAGTAAHQAVRFLHPPSPSGPVQRPGTPAGSIAAEGPGQTLFVTARNGAFTKSEIEKFRAAEEAKGNAVSEVAPGTLLVVPGGAPGNAAKRDSP